jgi:hypothetical protein
LVSLASSLYIDKTPCQLIDLLYGTNRRVSVLTGLVQETPIFYYTEQSLILHRRPYHGEIDILEGANNQANVLTSLHTAGTCTIAGSDETGSLQASNCT